MVLGKWMVTIKYDNQCDAISRDVPRDALALIDAGGNGSERSYTYDDIFRLSGAVARGLHPAVLSGHGLEVALQSIVAHSPAPVELSVELEERLPEQIEVAAYYVVSESLANIGKHAQASAATVSVAREDGTLVVEIADDGIGGADSEDGTGLRGLADRVEARGGRLRVWTPRGGGTRIRAEIPCG